MIVGTQKAGSTWLEYQLNQHPNIWTPQRQLHFFDTHFQKGVAWYQRQFSQAGGSILVGEKTTEYFDVLDTEVICERMNEVCPNAKKIVILRDPVARAISAAKHVVKSGLAAIPESLFQFILDDEKTDLEAGFRIVQRGFYDEPSKAYFRHFGRSNVLVLIFEEDIVRDPKAGLDKVTRFLGVPPFDGVNIHEPKKRAQLSVASIRLSRNLRRVPHARGVIRRADNLLRLTPWDPAASQEAYDYLAQTYKGPNQALFHTLGREIASWLR